MNDGQERTKGRKMTVFLTGFMGSGKSTVGRQLSRRLGLPFMDTDSRIEKEQKKSITDIFAAEGEEAFRNMETQVLCTVREEGVSRVVSTGGGLPMREENRGIMKDAGRVVFLRVRPETVYTRLQGDTTRPLLQKADPQAEVRRLLAERNPVYESGADLIVDVDGRTPEELAEEIAAGLLEKNGGAAPA